MYILMVSYTLVDLIVSKEGLISVVSVLKAYPMFKEYIGLFWSCDSKMESCKCPILHLSLLCLPKLHNLYLPLQLGVLLVYLFNAFILAVYIDALNLYIKS